MTLECDESEPGPLARQSFPPSHSFDLSRSLRSSSPRLLAPDSSKSSIRPESSIKPEPSIKPVPSINPSTKYQTQHQVVNPVPNIKPSTKFQIQKSSAPMP